MAIFVTGAAGFIGRNAVPLLLREKHAVVALQHREQVLPVCDKNLTIVHGSLNTLDAGVVASLRECDTILHLAGGTTPASSADAPLLELEENLLPTLKLLEAARQSRIRRVVFLSSGGTVYGPPTCIPIDESHPTHPTSPYGVGKLATEHFFRLWAARNGADCRILRVSNLYGPFQHPHGNQGVIGAWLRCAIGKLPLVIWGDGSVIRDYIFVRDAASAILAACIDENIPSGTYNIGSGTGLTLLEIAAEIGRATGLTPRIEFNPARSYDVPVNILSHERFTRACGWTPAVILREGMRLTLDWMNP
jgi:UDP-glucose 4-epimerase